MTTLTKTNQENSSSLLAVTIFGFFLILVMAFAFFQVVHDASVEREKTSEFRQFLSESAKKSEAHHFVAYHWSRCNGFFSSAAQCYSGIRAAAATRGNDFVTQVDAATKDMNLIKN